MQLQMELLADRLKRLDTKCFRHMKGHGRHFAVPDFLDPDREESPWAFMHHPATLSASTLDALETLVDEYDSGPFQAVPLEKFRDYNIFRQGDAVFATPTSAGKVDPSNEDERRRYVTAIGSTAEEVKGRLRTLGESATVEYVGWLPIFEKTANCGRHPQFGHTATPPSGYRFSCSAPRKRLSAPSWD